MLPAAESGGEVSDLDRLMRLATTMEPDALAVLVYLAERIRGGRAEYGDLDLDTDRRDWRVEQLQELADYATYRAMQAIVTERRGGSK